MEIAIQNWVTHQRNEYKKVDMLAKAGFANVDWDLRRYYEPSTYMTESIEDCTAHNTALREYMDKNGITVVQTHSTFPTYIGEKNELKMLAALENCFLATSILGAKYTVVHPLMPKKWEGSENREVRLNANIKFYNEIAPLAKKYDVVICIENMFGSFLAGKYKETACSRYEEMLVLFDALDDSNRFGFCFDAGHANLLYKDKIAEMIRALGTNIKVVHLHDNGGKLDMHRPPREGNVDWGTVMHTLREVGFNGVYDFEIMPCLGTFNRTRKLTKLHDYLLEFVSDYE